MKGGFALLPAVVAALVNVCVMMNNSSLRESSQFTHLSVLCGTALFYRSKVLISNYSLLH